MSPAQSNRRAMTILAIGGGLLLIFFLGTRLMGGGGGDDDLSAPITVPTTPGQGTTPTTAIGPGAQTPPEETTEVFADKNPFTPLVPTGGGTTGGGSTGGGSTGGGTGGTTNTTTPGTSVGGGTTGGGSTGGGTGGTTNTTTPGTSTGGGSTGGTQTEPRRSQRVALLDVYADAEGRQVANVRVNDTVYEAVAPGEEFATSYKLVALEGRCGTFLFGDDRFRLCEGEEVLK